MFEIKSFGKLRQLTSITPETFESLAKEVRSHYRSFDSRLGGGKWRHIDNPSQKLKAVQGVILRKVLQQVKLPEHMYGAKRGGSVREHARLHENQPSVLALDLRDCFPRTTHTRVHAVLSDRVGCNPTIAHLLTKICTLDHHLPQGAPTSGYLAHLALVDLFEELCSIARVHDLRVSMYVDDIALSGEPARVKRAIGPALEAIQRASHGVRNSKKQFMVGEDREITGIAIRKRICAPRDYLEKLERDLVAAARVGTVTATGYQSLQGRIRWVRSLQPRQASLLENIVRYVGASEVQDRRFAETVPCRSKASCRWRGARKSQDPG